MSACLLLLLLSQSPERSGNSIMRGSQAFSDGIRASESRTAESATFFREAVEWFETGRRAEGEAPWLLNWLGHSYLLSGDLPHAIAAYRRGLALDPAGPKLRTALAHAREQVQYPSELARILQPEREFWPPWLSLHDLGLYAFGLYFAACLAATRWWMIRRRRWLVAAGTLLVLAAMPAIGSLMEWQHQRRDAAQPIVVVARDVPLRVGNGPDYPPKLEMPRGCEVRQLFDRGGWLQVETGGGALGWLPADAVVRERRVSVQ